MPPPIPPPAAGPAHAHSGATAYRPDIDGLRAVAVLAVVVHHLAPELLPGGYVGVDVFFVISGYLITKIIHTEMSRGAFSFLGFYARRARRILPALMAVLLATVAVGWLIQLPSDYAFTLRAAAATVLSVSNVLFWDSARGYFAATDDKLNPLLHTWSLGVEEQFYFFFPFALLLWMRLARGARNAVLVVAGIGSLVLAEALVRQYPGGVFYLLPFRAWEFVVGGALAVGLVPASKASRHRTLLMLGGLAAIAWSCVAYGEATAFPGLSAAVPVVGAAAVIHAGAGAGALGVGGVPASLLTWRPMVYTGLISYSLYLWHWPVVVFSEYSGLVPLDGVGAVAAFGLSYVLAMLSHRFVERPFRSPAIGQQRMRLRLAAGVGIAAAIGVVAVVGARTEGFASRFNGDILALDAARGDAGRYLADCFDQPIERSCVLGAGEGPPDTLVWGDSHALSWAPAVDSQYQASTRRALLVATSACPPFVDIDNRLNLQCLERNLTVIDRLEDEASVRTVVLMGFWSTYFRPGGPIAFAPPAGGVASTPGGIEGAARALEQTITLLRSRGLRVVVVEPVPVYPKSVPTALAMEKLTGRTLLDRSLQKQQQMHAPFFEALDQVAEDAVVSRLKPFDWLCPAGHCQVVQGGRTLYRDSNHLSPYGASVLAPKLGAALVGPDPGDAPNSDADPGTAAPAGSASQALTALRHPLEPGPM